MAHSILWLKERNNPNAPPPPRSRRKARTFDENGRAVDVEDDLGNPVIERLPAVGHVGPVNNAVPMGSRRFIEYLRFDGHVVAATITGAAAAVADTDRSHQHYVEAKARYEGWIEKHTCPVDAVLSGAIKKQRLVAKECRDALAKGDRCAKWRPGDPPCKHFRAEEAARKARNVETDTKRSEAAKSEAAKSADAQTRALVQLAEQLATRAATEIKGKGKE